MKLFEIYLNSMNMKYSPSLETRPLTSKWSRFCPSESDEKDLGWPATFNHSCLLQSSPGISLKQFRVFYSASSVIKLLWLRLKGDHRQEPEKKTKQNIETKPEKIRFENRNPHKEKCLAACLHTPVIFQPAKLVERFFLNVVTM